MRKAIVFAVIAALLTLLAVPEDSSSCERPRFRMMGRRAYASPTYAMGQPAYSTGQSRYAMPGSPEQLPPPRGKEFAARTVRIVAYDNYFEPKTINVAPGTTVRWENKGEHGHTVTSDSRQFDSELAVGQAYSRTFDRPGTYYYYCRFHKGMQGTIVVDGGSRGSGGYSSGRSGY